MIMLAARHGKPFWGMLQREKEGIIFFVCAFVCVFVYVCVHTHSCMSCVMYILKKKYLESSHMKFLSESKVGKWSP